MSPLVLRIIRLRYRRGISARDGVSAVTDSHHDSANAIVCAKTGVAIKLRFVERVIVSFRSFGEALQFRLGMLAHTKCSITLGCGGDDVAIRQAGPLSDPNSRILITKK